jgi:hypothetical protein
MYSEDYFVVLEPDQAEQIITAAELVEKLRAVLATRSHELPADLQRFVTIDEQVAYLLNTACDLTLAPGQFLQWYAVRLEK